MLSSAEIEKQIEKYKLKFMNVRDEEIEWNLKFPMFVDSFARLVKQNGRVPSQDEFVERYFDFNSSELAQILSYSRLRTGLEARLRRTYPSLVRDAHLSALFAEKGMVATYDRDTDVQIGVDHVVKYKEVLFSVHAYVGTSRGRFGRKIKNRRHFFEGYHLDLILDLGGEKTKKVGDFYLYSEDDIQRLQNEMENVLKKQKQN